MANEIIKVEETEKEWTIVGEVANWEDFFMDEKNFLPVLNFAKERARGLVADPTTKDGQIARKSLAKRIGQVEKAIAERGLEVARILKEKPKKIDAVRKKVKDSLLSYKEELLAPLKEIEERQALIVEISNIPAQGIGCDSAGIKSLLESVEDYASKDWKESKDDATYVINEAKRQLTDMLVRQEKAEADARELEERRKHDAEVAQAQKEKAEAELKKAQEEAARAKEEAEKFKAEADAAKAEAVKANEEKATAEKAKEEAESKLPEWKKKEIPESERLFPENVEERKRKFNREALEKIVEFTNDEKIGKAIITAIVKGQVPHIYMDYELDK